MNDVTLAPYFPQARMDQGVTRTKPEVTRFQLSKWCKVGGLETAVVARQCRKENRHAAIFRLPPTIRTTPIITFEDLAAIETSLHGA